MTNYPNYDPQQVYPGEPAPRPRLVPAPGDGTDPPGFVPLTESAPAAPDTGSYLERPDVTAYRAEAPVVLGTPPALPVSSAWPGQPTSPSPAMGDPAAERAASYVYRPMMFSGTTRPAPAEWGLRGALNKLGFTLVPKQAEQLQRAAEAMVRSSFPGPRVITVANPKGGQGKTPTALLLAELLAALRREPVIAWDGNEYRGTLGLRAGTPEGARTVMDLVHSLEWLAGQDTAIGAVAGFLHRLDSGAMVLPSSSQAGAMQSLTHQQCVNALRVLFRGYSTVVLDTGNNETATTWQFAARAADVLVIPMSTETDGRWVAGLMLEGLYRSDATRHLVRNAVVVVTDPDGGRLPAQDEQWLASRVGRLCYVPADPEIGNSPMSADRLTRASCNAWIQVAAAVAEACTRESSRDKTGQ